MTKKTWAKCRKGIQSTNLEKKKIANRSHMLLSKERLRESNELEDKKESAFNWKIFKVRI